jgi:hypothetical protein
VKLSSVSADGFGMPPYLPPRSLGGRNLPPAFGEGTKGYAILEDKGPRHPRGKGVRLPWGYRVKFWEKCLLTSIT